MVTFTRVIDEDGLCWNPEEKRKSEKEKEKRVIARRGRTRIGEKERA